MHVDQSLRDMLNGPARGSARTCANQSKSSGQESRPCDSVHKGSDEPPAQSTQSKDECVEREGEPPDTTAKPEGKSLKTKEVDLQLWIWRRG